MSVYVLLSELVPKHAEAVFWHAVKHDYPALMDKAAYHLMSRSSALRISKRLPPHLKIPWVSGCSLASHHTNKGLRLSSGTAGKAYSIQYINTLIVFPPRPDLALWSPVNSATSFIFALAAEGI